MKFFIIKIAAKALALIAFFITMGTAHGAEWSVGETVVGKATWYGKKHHGQLTAFGKKFNMYNPSVAHMTLPKGTLLLVRNKANGRQLVLEVTDRGPYRKDDPNIVLDLSYAGAKYLGYVRDGIANVEIMVLLLG